ncbi:MarC family protein [Pikeienuella sp. HZG-20]|uniref:MarC family protein n=1 Tax=Paludibacillus litoralis TaxID=3133267 RepID=UPI0030EE7E69
MTEAFLIAFTTLFVMIDPIGVAPLFAALTQGAKLRARAVIAARGVLIAGALLLLFGLAGDAALRGIGVSVSAFRIAGGLMLFLLAVDMLFEKRSERRKERADAESDADDPSVFPLATPMIAGPGSLTAMILLTAERESDLGETFAVYAALFAVLLTTFLFLLATDLIERILGATGIKVLTRLFGMLLGALAVQFVMDGISAYVSAL